MYYIVLYRKNLVSERQLPTKFVVLIVTSASFPPLDFLCVVGTSSILRHWWVGEWREKEREKEMGEWLLTRQSEGVCWHLHALLISPSYEPLQLFFRFVEAYQWFIWPFHSSAVLISLWSPSPLLVFACNCSIKLGFLNCASVASLTARRCADDGHISVNVDACMCVGWTGNTNRGKIKSYTHTHTEWEREREEGSSDTKWLK